MDASSEPSQDSDGDSRPRCPVRRGAWIGLLKLVMIVGIVLFLQRVVLPSLGIGT